MDIKVFRRKLYDKMLQWKTERGSKVCPLEVMSSGYKNHTSFDAFIRKYPERVARAICFIRKTCGKMAARFWFRLSI